MKYTKRYICLILSVMLIFSLTACRGANDSADTGSNQQEAKSEETAEETLKTEAPETAESAETASEETAEASAAEESESVSETNEPFKVAIVTGTLQDGEEEYATAQRMAEKYPDIIVTACYPDNYATEPDTLIATYTALAADPQVKAIVSVQAVAGTAAAIEKVKETRDDILFFAGNCADHPDVMTELETFILAHNVPEAWRNKAKLAHEMGAKTVIYYSFPRHQSNHAFASGRAMLEEYCKEVGMEFVYVTTPDNQSEAGIYGVQQFVAEDVPRQIKTYGKDTAFLGTNCHQQAPMMQAVLEGGAIFPMVCCWSPLHKYPSGLDIDMSGHPGDLEYCMEQIQKVVDEKGMNGRFASANVGPYTAYVTALTEYAIKVLKGETNGTSDLDTLKKCIEEVAPGVELVNYTYDGKAYENYLGFIAGVRIY